MAKQLNLVSMNKHPILYCFCLFRIYIVNYIPKLFSDLQFWQNYISSLLYRYSFYIYPEGATRWRFSYIYNFKRIIKFYEHNWIVALCSFPIRSFPPHTQNVVYISYRARTFFLFVCALCTRYTYFYYRYLYLAYLYIYQNTIKNIHLF